MKRINKQVTYSMICYLLIISSYFIFSFLPDTRIWGLNWWAFIPSGIVYVLLSTGILIPIILWFLLTPYDMKASSKDIPDLSSPQLWFISLTLIIITGISFYIFSNKTHFLGDGYTLLSLLSSEQPFIKPRNYGGTIIQSVLAEYITGRTELGIKLAYQLVSYAAGLGIMVFVAISSMKLFKLNYERLLFFLVMITGGYMLLSYGYVENYALFVFSITIFSILGILISNGRINRFWIVIPASLSIFFHIFGLMLIPAIVYLIFNSTFYNAISRNIYKKKTITLVLVVITLLGGIIYFAILNNSRSLSLILLPIFSDRFVVDDYYLLSINHIVDMISLIITLTPYLPILIVSMFFGEKIRLFKSKEITFLAYLTVSLLLGVFVINPKLGMPRDWDLFAFIGIPLTMLGYYVLLKVCNTRRHLIYIGGLAISISLVTLSGRIAISNLPHSGIEQVMAYTQLDPVRNRNVGFMVAKYYDDIGEEPKADSIKKSWRLGRTNEQLLYQAAAQMEQGYNTSAINVLYKIINDNPTYADAWAHLGQCYIRIGNIDSATIAAEIADGLNPYNEGTLYLLGQCYFQKGEYSDAEEVWLRTARKVPQKWEPWFMMMRMYQEIDDEDEYVRCLEIAASKPSSPYTLLRELGDYYLTNLQYSQADSLYRLAINKGLDSSYVLDLKKRYPDLIN